MNFWQVIKYEMTNLTFEGRASKREFFYYKLFRFLCGIIFLLLLVIPAVLLIMGYKNIIHLPFAVMIALGIILFIFVAISSLFGFWFIAADACVAVRRLHDFEYSGWYYLIFIAISFISQAILQEKILVLGLLNIFLVLFEFCIGCFINGSAEKNEFGEKSTI